MVRSERSEPAVWLFTEPRPASVVVQERLRTNTLLAAVAAARAGAGYALAPDYLIEGDLKAGALEAVLTDWRAEDATVYALAAEGGDRVRKVALFVEALRCYMEDASAPGSGGQPDVAA